MLVIRQTENLYPLDVCLAQLHNTVNSTDHDNLAAGLQTAPGQGSKPCYCLNPTGNKEGARKAADSCLKYVPIQTFPFLSARFCF